MKKNENDLREYRTGKLTVLQLMSLLAILGIVLTWVLQHAPNLISFFSSR